MKEPIYKFIDINVIIANENQPRTHFENEKIQELAESIKSNGLLQPIVVRPYGDVYQIVVGERRYRACRLAQLDEVPCIIQDYDEDQTATAALVENIQRENLSAIEEALAYQSILDSQNLTQEELAKQVGKSQSTVANKLRLLQLPITVQESIRKKEITERHARALLQLDTTEKRNKMLKEIVSKKLTVDETEKKIKQKQKKKVISKKISQNVKIAINTIEQAVKMVKQTGIEIETNSEETDDEYIMIVKIKK
jgi:ParB-like partition proteins